VLPNDVLVELAHELAGSEHAAIAGRSRARVDAPTFLQRRVHRRPRAPLVLRTVPVSAARLHLGVGLQQFNCRDLLPVVIMLLIL
jgi:hypothetical protein